jgi:membrane protease YdiL (CAAX protease family)
MSSKPIIRVAGAAIKQQVLSFFALAFLISWAIWLGPTTSIRTSLHIQVAQYSLTIPWAVVVQLVGNIGPALSAIILTTAEGGRPEVIGLLRRLAPQQPIPVWYFVAILLPIGVTWVGLTFHMWPNSYRPGPGTGIHGLRVLFANFLFAPLMEEIGWRGYLLPRLQLRHSGFASAIFVGMVWGPWHLPIYWRVVNTGTTGRIFLAFYLVNVIGLSVLFTWMYNASRESLAVTVVAHASFDVSAITLLAPMMVVAGVRPFAIVTIVVCATAALILLLTGPNLSYTRR